MSVRRSRRRLGLSAAQLQAFLDTVYAPIASPTFTGVPAAPTASPGTNTTQLATTAFVAAVRDALLNGAGPAYDTLLEIANLLISDESTAAALATTVAGKEGHTAYLTTLGALADHAALGAALATAYNNATYVARATHPEVLAYALSDETTAITTGTEKLSIRMPFAMTLTGVRASLATVSSSGIPTVDINEAGATILSTKLTIDANELTSTTAAVPAVISDASLADDALITFDIDVAGTGAKGLKVALIGTRVV